MKKIMFLALLSFYGSASAQQQSYVCNDITADHFPELEVVKETAVKLRNFSFNPKTMESTVDTIGGTKAGRITAIKKGIEVLKPDQVGVLIEVPLGARFNGKNVIKENITFNLSSLQAVKTFTYEGDGEALVAISRCKRQ